MKSTFLRSAAMAALIVLLLTGAAAAQDERPRVPDGKALIILTRNTVVAVNQGNLTGNYSVLRDLGTPDFAANNTAAHLGDIFRGWRDQDLDLSPIVLFDPVWTLDPAIDDDGRMRLKGYFPTQPLQITFDLIYELVGNKWRLFGIKLATL